MNYYTQPGKLFLLMSPAQQKVLFENTARNIAEATKEVKAIGIPLKEIPKK